MGSKGLFLKMAFGFGRIAFEELDGVDLFEGFEVFWALKEVVLMFDLRGGARDKAVGEFG